MNFNELVELMERTDAIVQTPSAQLCQGVALANKADLNSQ